MQEKNSEQFLYQEEEIDFGKLILTLLASKGLIIALTLVLTTLVAIYNFTLTPIYQATATVILGNYETPKVTCSDVLYHQSSCTTTPSRKKFVYSAQDSIVDLNMQVLHKIKNPVSISHKNNYSFVINSEAISNEIAKNSILEIMSYVQKKHQDAFANIKNSRAEKIKSFDKNINKIEKFELAPLNTKSTQELKVISQKIDYVNSRQLPPLDKQIYLLENRRLPALVDQLNKLNEIIDKTIDAQVQEELVFIQNKLPQLIEKISLYNQNLTVNEELLTQSEDNLQKLENSSMELAALRLTKIQGLRANIFHIKEKIIDLEMELNGLILENKLLESYIDIGLLENTPTFPSEIVIGSRLLTIPYFENIIYDYKINSVEIEEEILSIQSSQLPLLKEKRENLKLKLIELENEKFFFINYRLPEYELSKDRSATKLKNTRLQKNDYESLLTNNNYTNAAISGGIITKNSPFKPNIRRNIIIAFLISFMLSIFIVLVINLSKNTINKQTA